MPKSVPSLLFPVVATVLVSVHAPYGLALAKEAPHLAAPVPAALPSTVAEQRVGGGSPSVRSSNRNDSARQSEQYISSEIDLATGDGQQRCVPEDSTRCAGAMQCAVRTR